jgi:hypothetical protein
MGLSLGAALEQMGWQVAPRPSTICDLPACLSGTPERRSARWGGQDPLRESTCLPASSAVPHDNHPPRTRLSTGSSEGRETSSGSSSSLSKNTRYGT